MQTSIKERLKKVVAYIKLENNGIKQDEIAAELGYNPNYFSGVINEKLPLSESTAKVIEDKYHINKEWLLSGEGDMISVNQRIGRIDNNHGNISGNVAGDVNIGCGERIKELEAEISKQRKEIESLSQTNQKLLDQVFRLTDRLLDR